MKSADDMVHLNKKQGKFYDMIHEAEALTGHGGYAGNRSANVLTRLWAKMRYQQQSAVRLAGIDERKQFLHRTWISRKEAGDFLEIGCFSGTEFTFSLIEASGKFLGIDLSAKAIEALRAKVRNKGFATKAELVACDLLSLEENRKFDLLFAHGVLHHFENPDALFAKLVRLLKGDGIMIFTEPIAINPGYSFVRAIYRPFQSDAAWEWPFSSQTVKTLEKYFMPLEGFGWGRWSLPISVLTGLPLVGRLLVPFYLWLAKREMDAGWHSRVWNNSYVTAVYRVKPAIEEQGCSEAG